MKSNEQITGADLDAVVEFLKANGAGTLVKRTKVNIHTCDFVMPGTIRNDDSLGRGPDERILFGTKREVAYPVESLARYMLQRGFKVVKRQVSINE